MPDESQMRGTGTDASEILRRRAAELAQPASIKDTDSQNEWGDVLVVRVGKDRLCIPTRFVREVAVLGRVLALPGLPDFYAGVSSLHSHVYAVVDGARLFGLGRTINENAGEAPVQGVILQGPDPESPETEFALVVDDVSGVVTVKAADVSAVPEGMTERLERYGYAMVRAAGEYCLVLDMEKVLSDDALRVDGAQ
ncbi:MAG: chemotaxis protein CheW [Oceanidesulfovibrio sp.]